MTNNELLGLIERITALNRRLWEASSVNVPASCNEWTVTFDGLAQELERAAELLREHAKNPQLGER